MIHGTVAPLAVAGALLLAASAARAQDAAPPLSPAPVFDPYFAGYQSEPGMDFGGRTLASIDRGAARALGAFAFLERKPAIAAAWEFPLGLFLSTVTHEFNGHGGRAREFHLSPSYGFGFDFSAYTETRRAPRTSLELVLLASGGTEADMVLAQRLQRDFLRTGGAEAWTFPMLLFAKLDLSLYVAETSRPDHPGDDFRDEFDNGNDIAIWIVSRQGARAGIDPATIWNRDYAIDYSDPLLHDNYDAARATAVWNLLDPAFVTTAIAYVRGHLLHGAVRIEPPALRLGRDYAVTAGTHGALGPAEVSRYFDVYLRTPAALLQVYVRDLDSSIDRSYGAGAVLHELRVAPGLTLSLQGDSWNEPASLEFPDRRSSGWNATAELNMIFGRWGLAAMAGRKSDGFVPGRPSTSGTYVGGGLLASF